LTVAIVSVIGVLLAAIIGLIGARKADLLTVTVGPQPTTTVTTSVPGPTVTVTETPSVGPSTAADSRPSGSGASAEPSENPGSLTLQLDFGRSNIGKDIYQSPHQFGWTSSVYDDNGTLSDGCYIKWALYHGKERIFTYRTVCNNNPYTGLRLGPGKYNFVGHITTDDGRKGVGSKTFSVVSS
jgi:hypothetical protein